MWWLLSDIAMSRQVALSLAAGSLALVAYCVANTVHRCQRAVREFRESSRGLPIVELPGGLWGALTNHGVQMFLGRESCRRITALHARHGATFGWLYGERFCASTIDLDLIRLICHKEQATNINRMPFSSVIREFEHDGIFLARNEQWRRLRRAFGPALKKFKTPNMLEEIEAAVGALVGHLESQLLLDESSSSSKKNNAKNITSTIRADKLMHRFSLDVVFRCLYKQRGLIDYAARECPWVEVLDEALGGPITKPVPMRLALAFPWCATPLDWLAKNFTNVGVWFRDVWKFIELQTRNALETRRQLIKRQSVGGGGTDTDTDALIVENFKLADGTEYKRYVVDYVIDQFLDGKLTRSEYFNSSFLLFNAADKTVADALHHTLYYLAVNQRVQQKLRHSLALEGLESAYLGWVINESLRLHPPAAIGCSRTTERDIELPNGAGRLPAGTFVLTPLNTIHRSRAIWGADAHDFKPERFADTSHHHPMQFMPFGAGLRACPGRELALFEMRKLLLETVSRFEFECAPKPDIDNFDSPYMLYSLPHSPTLIKVTKNARPI